MPSLGIGLHPGEKTSREQTTKTGIRNFMAHKRAKAQQIVANKADFNALNEAAIKVSDGVVLGSPEVSAELKTVILKAGVPFV